MIQGQGFLPFHPFLSRRRSLHTLNNSQPHAIIRHVGPPVRCEADLECIHPFANIFRRRCFRGTTKSTGCKNTEHFSVVPTAASPLLEDIRRKVDWRLMILGEEAACSAFLYPTSSVRSYRCRTKTRKEVERESINTETCVGRRCNKFNSSFAQGSRVGSICSVLFKSETVSWCGCTLEAGGSSLLKTIILSSEL